MITSLKITDGTTTADLVDNTNYMLVDGGLDLGIAKIRASELGGRGPIDEIEGSIIVDVLSKPADIATTLANIEKLQQFALQCQRWSKGTNVAGVYLEIRIGAGTARRCMLTHLEIQPPNTFADLLMVQEVAQIKLAFVRRGAWLQAVPESGNLTLNTTVAQTVGTINFVTNLINPSPITVRYTFSQSLLTDSSMRAVVLGTENSQYYNSIKIVEAETLTTNFTSVNDSARSASNGKVGRVSLTANNSTIVRIPFVTGIAANLLPKRYIVYAVLAGNTAGIWSMQLRATRGVGYGIPSKGPTLIFQHDGIEGPVIFRVGDVINSVSASVTEIEIKNITSGTTVLDVDYFVIVGQSSDQILEIDVPFTNLTGFNFSNITLNINTNPFGLVPTVQYEDGTATNVVQPGYTGNAFISCVNGNTLGWCTTILYVGFNLFRPVSSSFNVSASHYPAKLTPQ